MKTRLIQMETLPPVFRKHCLLWWDSLPPAERVAVDAWLVDHPVQLSHAFDLVPYTYIEAPGTIDPWIICKTSAADATPEWLANFQPNIEEVLPSGDVHVRFRQSELNVAAASEGSP